jgi:hypothetical protein
MHGSELPPLAAPPISIMCGGCRNEMRLASVDPTNETTVYTYQCANGHRRQFSTTDFVSICALIGLQFIWRACCGTGPKPSFRRRLSEANTWVSSSKFSGIRA